MTLRIFAYGLPFQTRMDTGYHDPSTRSLKGIQFDNGYYFEIMMYSAGSTAIAPPAVKQFCPFE